MRPVAGSIDRPAGRFAAVKVSGPPSGSRNCAPASMVTAAPSAASLTTTVGTTATGGRSVTVRTKLACAWRPVGSVAVTVTG